MIAPLEARIPLQETREPGLRDSDVLREVLQGLRATPKTLPPKLFYDAAGTALFERICRLPEYYLTRAETEILAGCASELASLAGPKVALVEYGSGAGEKVRQLLHALHDPVAYVGIDIAKDQLLRATGALAADHPGLTVRALASDYTRRVLLPPLPPHARRVAFFPGSTIGNFAPSDAAMFLQSIGRIVGPDGALILGVDRIKDERLLHAAYNDAAGVTEAFNLNVLRRLNREVGANFQPSLFRHHATFNSGEHRIEMHLVSTKRHTVRLAGMTLRLDGGESIVTEYSYKYDEASLHTLVEAGGFAIDRLWTDRAEQFWVGYLRLRSGEPRASTNQCDSAI